MSDPRCNHVKDIVPWPAGSWVERKTSEGLIVLRGICGKFYGHRRDETAAETRRRQPKIEELNWK